MAKKTKAGRERDTLRDYIARHGKERGIVTNGTRLSRVVVNGKTMTCTERDNLIVFMYKKYYNANWIAGSLGVPVTIVTNVISNKVR